MLIKETEKAMAPHPSTPAWKNPMDGGAWKAAVHGVAEGWTQLSDFTFTFHALEKEMAKETSRHLKLMNSALSPVSEDARVWLVEIMPPRCTFTV